MSGVRRFLSVRDKERDQSKERKHHLTGRHHHHEAHHEKVSHSLVVTCIIYTIMRKPKYLCLLICDPVSLEDEKDAVLLL